MVVRRKRMLKGKAMVRRDAEQLSKGSAAAAAAAAKSLQSCPTLCDPIDGSPPGSPVPGILQAKTLDWGAIAFSESGVLGSHEYQEVGSILM